MLNIGQTRWRSTSSISALVNGQKDISSGKRWRTKENVSMLFESELSSSFLVPSSNSRTFRKYYQSCMARQSIVTRRFYRVSFSRRKRKKKWGQQWTIVWFQEESVSKQADKLYSSLLWIRSMIKMAQGKSHATCYKQENSAIQKYLETLPEYSILVQLEARSTKRTAISFKKGETQFVQSSLRNRYAWRPRISFIKGKAWF